MANESEFAYCSAAIPIGWNLMMAAKEDATIQPWGVVPRPVDFHFDIPINLAASIVGFRHDHHSDAIMFYELKPEEKLRLLPVA